MSGLDMRDNPYVGLRPFFIEDSLYFFGREQQTSELMEILREHRFLGVVGSSGSGKSSLVRAGLLPGLLGGFLVHDRDRWRTVQIKPGDAPIGNLATGLIEAMEQVTSPDEALQLDQDIREGHTEAVLDFLEPRLENNANLFLLVDQFEEIFAYRGTQDDEAESAFDHAKRKDRALRKAEAVDFVDLLLALAEQRRLPIYVVLTMRTDFLGDCDLFFGLPEALNKGRYLVPRMDRRQLSDAIECPPQLLDVNIAPRLLDHVLNELADRFDRLPLLQHALLRTWDEWQMAGRVGPIDLPQFEATGGLRGALAQDAESALQGLDLDVTARIFKRLTDTDKGQRRVRSPARISELVDVSMADPGTVEGIVRRFQEHDRNFVYRSADGNPDDPRIDISHESLIRQWGRLRSWVDQERWSRDQYLELVQESRAWERKEAALLWPPGLQAVLNWREKNSPSRAWARRYSATREDWDKALDYLDESVKVRCEHLAEKEVAQRWAKKWNPAIVVIEVILGVGLAVEFKLGEGFSTLIHAMFTSIKDLSIAPIMSGSGVLFDWAIILVALASCVGINRYVKQKHHETVYPKVHKAIVAMGGHDPVENEPKADAVVMHQTSYASAYKRFMGFALDTSAYALFFIVAVLGSDLIINGTSGFLETDKVASEAEMNAPFIATFVFGWLYSSLQISSKRQATYGMRRQGVFRTDLHGNTLSFGRASALYGLRFFSYAFYFLGFLSQFFTKKRQTFHDWAARSVVLDRISTDIGDNGEQKKPTGILVKVFGVIILILFVFGLIGLMAEGV